MHLERVSHNLVSIIINLMHYGKTSSRVWYLKCQRVCKVLRLYFAAETVIINSGDKCFLNDAMTIQSVKEQTYRS